MEGKEENGPKSILNKNQTNDFGAGEQNKKNSRLTKGFDRREPMAGILRVDCSKPRRSSGSSVDFGGTSNRLTTQVEPPSPQPSVDRLSVTFADKNDWSDSSVKINIFDPGSPPSQVSEMEKVLFSNNPTACVKEGEVEEEEDDDYSVSVSVIMQRRESMKRGSSRRKKRRTSSPLPDADGIFHDSRRRSSEYTNSSGDTAISIETEATQEQIFENIRLHKEVLSSVKLQPWGMRRKIKLVQQAKAYVKKHEGELQERLAMSKSTKDILARFNIWLIKKLRFLKRELANTMTLLIPWELRIKEIESHFGSAVASYFTFLRWMFWVNLVITVVLACFVAIPEMLTADVKTAGERKEMLPEEKLTATNLVTLWDFGGVLKYSPIFYGYYTNRDGSGTGYRLPFAYFMTGLAVYVYSFVATLRRMAENSRMSKLSEKDDECIFTWKLFTGWDYMIGNAETAHNRVASLILGFKEALLEETERKKDEKNWKIICVRVLVSFVVIGLLAFSAYIVFVVVERSTQPETNNSWWRQNEITVSVSIISLLFPFFFELLGLLEGYHPRKSLRIQLARIMVLNLLNLYTLIFSQFWKISDMTIELQKLKKNYTSFYPSVTPSVIESSGPICFFVVVNCSTSLAATETTLPLSSISTTVSSLFFNTTTASYQMVSMNASNYENLTTGFTDFDESTTEQLYNATHYLTNEILNVSTMETYLSSYLPSSSSSSSSTSSDYFTVKTNSTFYDSTLTSLEYSSSSPTNVDSIFSKIFDRNAPSTTNDFPTSENSFNETQNYSDEISSDSIESDPTVQSVKEKNSDIEAADLSFDFKELKPNVINRINGRENSQQNLCYLRKCEKDAEVSKNEKNFHSIYDMETRKRLRSLCWETMFGQELVKLTVMDLILTILSVLILDFFRAIFVRVMNNCWCWDLEKKFPQYGDFKIAENILHLVYNQGMVWMGMFFSPGLPAINLIKLAIMMYLRSWAVLTCNVPHEVVFRASRSNNFYLALLLTMLFLCVLPVGFAIVWIEPSWHCGPFSDYKRIYHLFTKTLQKALPKTLHKAFDYIASPGIIIPLLMLLVLIIYYLVSLTNSLREANNDLKIQLRRERTEERRKMFQMVNKRTRKESKDSEMPFAKWKKLLPELAAKQLTLASDVEKGVKSETEITTDLKKEMNRKELLARLMKKALKKPSGTSEEDLQCPDEVTGNQLDLAFLEKQHKLKKSIAAKKEPEFSEKFQSEPENKTKISIALPERKFTSISAEENGDFSTPRNSQPENIPVIKISKTESDEYLQKEDCGSVKGKDAKEGRTKFIKAVEKLIKMKRKEMQIIKQDVEMKGRKTVLDEEKIAERKNPEKSINSNEKPKENEDDREKDEENEKKCPIAKEEVIPSELNFSTEKEKNSKNKN